MNFKAFAITSLEQSEDIGIRDLHPWTTFKTSMLAADSVVAPSLIRVHSVAQFYHEVICLPAIAFFPSMPSTLRNICLPSPAWHGMVLQPVANIDALFISLHLAHFCYLSSVFWFSHSHLAHFSLCKPFCPACGSSTFPHGSAILTHDLEQQNDCCSS